EWSKALAWSASGREIVPWVRIPVPPPNYLYISHIIRCDAPSCDGANPLPRRMTWYPLRQESHTKNHG
ncbi:MAG: hypothetical protein CO073_01265, partial [Candidatus Komeilibacteria bacterium CG_4_9_14_0_8_um_filter_36_9]